MRLLAAIAALILCACTPPTPSGTPEDASAGSSGVGRVEAEPFTFEAEALVGLWSFDRSCGLYDLVFEADGQAHHFDYSNESRVISYAGSWASADHNQVALTLRVLGPDGAPQGEALAYNLDVASAVTDDLIGDFGRAGGVVRAITARRCAEEDRN
jgi:hypothetical protein